MSNVFHGICHLVGHLARLILLIDALDLLLIDSLLILDSVKCISWNLSHGRALGSIDFAEEPTSHSFLTLLTDFGYSEPIQITAKKVKINRNFEKMFLTRLNF